MKCVVTGGAGFIGSHLVDRLLSDGYVVTVVDNLSTGKLRNLEQHFANRDFKFIQGDLLDIQITNKVMIDCDVVFHIASHSDVREGERKSRIDLENGTIATYNILESMRINGVSKIVFASSASVYGLTPGIPMSEDYGPLLPISLYGANKVAAEAIISAYCNTFDLFAWMFRFANVVGSRRQNGVVTDFVRKLKENCRELEILGNGKQCKPLVL